MHNIYDIKFDKKLSLVIEASAGTGKTWTLERIFIKALLNFPELKLSQFLVVTFTKIATYELKERIKKQIEITIDDFIYYKNTQDITQIKDTFNCYLIKIRTNYLTKDIAHLVMVLNNFDTATIKTIHGFCNYILKNYQLETKVDLSNNIVNNINDTLEVLIKKFLLIHVFNSRVFLNKIKDIFLLLQIIFVSDDIDSIVRALIKKISNFIIYYNNQFISQYKILEDYNLVDLLQDSLTISKKELILISAVVDYVVREYNIIVVKDNMITQNDLISIVADNLSNNVLLCDKLYQEFPIAFIDEFQDTDIYQWKIFNAIYRIDQDLRGYFIVVGDPKQAIYSFRGADINTYINAKAIISDNLNLVDNYRSHPDIIKFINHLFNENNINGKLGNNIIYSDITPKCDINKLIQIAKSNDIKQELSKFMHCDFEFSNKSVQIITCQNNDGVINAVVFEILTLLQVNPDLIDKIAVLVYQKSEANAIMTALNKYGVKAVTNIGINIFATDTATDFYNILLAIYDLSNTQQLNLALSSSLFGLPYEKLIRNEYEDIINLMFNYKEIVKDSIISLIYTFIDDLSLLYKKNNLSLVDNKVNELVHLAEILHIQYAKNKNFSNLLYWFKNKLNLLVTENEDFIANEDELIRLDNSKKQILIMTQHKAKGLEFEIVFCPFFAGIKDYLKDANEKVTPTYYDLENNFLPILSHDKKIAEKQKNEDFFEKQRLNYVALTRAKSRMYIYLTKHEFTSKGELSKLQKYYPINYLFGLENDSITRLFNYNNIFHDKNNAILEENLKNIVDIIDRSQIDINLLSLLSIKASFNQNLYFISDIKRKKLIDEYWQSYSNIIFHDNNGFKNNSLFNNVSIKNKLSNDIVMYKYSFLYDLSGKDFGILVHALCENYPFNIKKVNEILVDNNFEFKYELDDLFNLVEDILNYKIFNDLSILQIDNKKYELGFNISIDNNNNNLIKLLTELIKKYYGVKHPYTIAIKDIKYIRQGFLKGFIDLIFELDGKYYILDYKTNIVNQYQSCFDCYNENNYENSLLQVNAKHHYYLQYLIYLVAMKRYLEVKLNIVDATYLIGGAIYYYVRASCIIDLPKNSGIYIDDKCQMIISDIDNLLKGL